VRGAVDPRECGKAEVDGRGGDAGLAGDRLGWRPKVTFRQLVERRVDADTARLARGERQGQRQRA